MSTFTTVVKSDPDSPPIEGYEETVLGLHDFFQLPW